jgi:hypothetical protein
VPGHPSASAAEEAVREETISRGCQGLIPIRNRSYI